MSRAHARQHPLQISHKPLFFFPGYVLIAVMNLVHYAMLSYCLRKYFTYGLGKVGKIIRTSDLDIMHSTYLKFNQIMNQKESFHWSTCQALPFYLRCSIRLPRKCICWSPSHYDEYEIEYHPSSRWNKQDPVPWIVILQWNAKPGWSR